MDAEFVIKSALAIVGAALIAGGIVALVRGKTTVAKAWGAAAAAAGVVMWLIILFTTITSMTTITS